MSGAPERKIWIAGSEVELRVGIFGWIRVFVDGVRVKPKRELKPLERSWSFELRVGETEKHDLKFEFEMITRGSWECRIFVDRELVRRFEDNLAKGMSARERAKATAWIFAAYAGFFVLIFLFLRR